MCCGEADWTVGFLRANADVKLPSSDPRPGFLWAALEGFTREERALFLQFVTGTSKVPLDGFDPPFTIMASTHESGAAAFPAAHSSPSPRRSAAVFAGCACSCLGVPLVAPAKPCVGPGDDHQPVLGRRQLEERHS